MFINYYDILNIPFTATDEQIKKAYRLNAIKFHPDKNSGDEYFTKRFLEIKEAYDNLIDTEKRQAFDIRYRDFFIKVSDGTNQREYEQKKQEEKKKQRDEEEKFRYDPYKPFYSPYDREQQDTPQVEPLKTPWGNEINGVLEFFYLPKKIGKIVGAFSTLKKGKTKTSYFKYFFSSFLAALATTAIFGIVVFFLWRNWYYNLHKSDATATALIIIGVLFSFFLIVILYNSRNDINFIHTNIYLGINGFAIFKCEESISNVNYKHEINFNNITDLVTRFEIRRKNFQYVNTAYQYLWLNTITKKVVFEGNGVYADKDDSPNMLTHIDYWLNKEAEKYWTVYLLDTLETKLQRDGYVEFNLYHFENHTFTPFIRIGIGFITFLSNNENFTYKFNDIKRIYSKNSELFIEHKNFEKKLYFFKSGNQNSIPLRNLCNRQFFFKAIELLLGYSIL